MLKSLVHLDVMERMGAALLNAGWYIDQKTGKYSVIGRSVTSHERKWVYVNPVPFSPCNIYQMIVNSCGFIPSNCLNCWKIVVKPHTFYELMKLREFMQEYTEGHIYKKRFCKCGIEERAYTPVNYGGYFYNRSKEEGLMRWRAVREGMDKINPHIPVILKRYCTEFELQLGPSDKYEWPDGTAQLEAAIFKAVDLKSQGKNRLQPDYLVAHNIRKWMEFAWSIGDMTVMGFNDGQPLFTPIVTYHDHLLEERLEPKGGKVNVEA